MRIGIDLGGTKIEGVLISSYGKTEHSIRVATPQGDYHATLGALAQLVDQLGKLTDQTLPVGLATPGTISSVTGKMKNCNSTCLNGQRLKEDLSQLLNREVRVANDADCFVLSEATDGAGAGFDTVFGVILGTGVGGGICHKGELLQGANGIAGEWGHNPMPPISIRAESDLQERRHCYCDRFDCIETYLSGPALEDSYFKSTQKQASAATIVQKASEGDANALYQLDLYQERLACALATVINLLDPDIILLGGGMSNIDDLYKEVPRRWCSYVFSDECRTLLSKPKHGDSSGVRGAAWLWP